jgi:exportin-5
LQNGQSSNEIPGLDDIVSESFFNVITTNPTVLEPVILFMNSALRVRDTQSVGCVISALRGLLPVFEHAGPPHEYLCNDILKSVITSLHEPYYVDLQKDLAGFIVRIIHVDAELSAKVISSLPGLSQQPEKVMNAITRVRASPSEKVARAVVLDLLEQIRGVSIHEMGRIGGPKKSRTAAKLLAQLEAQMNPTAAHPQPAATIERGGSPALDGMASLLEG